MKLKHITLAILSICGIFGWVYGGKIICNLLYSLSDNQFVFVMAGFICLLIVGIVAINEFLNNKFKPRDATKNKRVNDIKIEGHFILDEKYFFDKDE